MLNRYVLNFDGLPAASNDRYVDNNDIRIVNLAPVALFSNYKLTTSPGKNLEDISHAYIVSLKYIVITSARDSNELSGGFDRDRNRRQRELNENKNRNEKYHITISLEEIFGFAEHQKKLFLGSVTN